MLGLTLGFKDGFEVGLTLGFEDGRRVGREVGRRDGRDVGSLDVGRSVGSDALRHPVGTPYVNFPRRFGAGMQEDKTHAFLF